MGCEAEIGAGGEHDPPLAGSVVINTGLDDGAGHCVAGQREIGKHHVVGAAVDPVDDGIGGALELIMQPAFDEAAEDGIGRLLPVEGEAGDIRFAIAGAHRPVHGFDDVAAYAEVAERGFEPGFDEPLRRADLFGEAEAFKPGGATDQPPAKVWVFTGAWAQVGDASAFVGEVAERPVETGPAFGRDLFLQPRANILSAAPRTVIISASSSHPRMPPNSPACAISPAS